MPNQHYVPTLERIQKQSKSMKQGSGESFPEEYAREVVLDLTLEQEDVYSTYDHLVKDGVANEVARINTPVSRYTKMRAKTDLRNWLGFVQLRLAPNAQWEIREYAKVVADIIKQLYPKTWSLFEEHTLNAVKFSGSEIKALRDYLLNHESLSGMENIMRINGVPDRMIRSVVDKLFPGWDK